MQGDVDQLSDILLAIPEQRVTQLQQGLSRVWQRFLYSTHKLFPASLERARAEFHDAWEGAGSFSSLPKTVSVLREDDDAFATILQWLHSRLDG